MVADCRLLRTDCYIPLLPIQIPVHRPLRHTGRGIRHVLAYRLCRVVPFAPTVHAQLPADALRQSLAARRAGGNDELRAVVVPIAVKMRVND